MGIAIATDFSTGQGQVDAVAQELVAGQPALPRLYNGVSVKAGAANTGTLYVGRLGVATVDGYPLAKSEEIEIPIDSIHKVGIVADPAGNSSLTVTLALLAAGGKFVLTYDGESTEPLAHDAASSAVQAALEALSNIGASNVTVSGSAGGPYTVTLVGDLAKTDALAMTGDCINEVQTITITNGVAGDKLVLTYDGSDTEALDYGASADDVQAALEVLVGEGNVSVAETETGYTVEFIGDLANTDVAAITGVGGTNEVQTITLSGGIAGDTWVLSWDGHDSAPLAYDITGEDLQTAMEAMDGIESGDVSVSGDGPYVVTFGGLLANTDVAAITGVGGTNEVQTITLSGGIAGDTWVLSWDGHDSAPLAYDITGEDLQTAMEAMDGIESGDVSVSGDGPYVVTFGGLLANTDVAAITGVGGTNEVQTITLSGGIAGDTWVLSWDGHDSAPLAYDITGEDLQTAMEAMDGIESGDVSVSGDGPYVVTAGGLLANTDVAAITGVGGTNEVQTITLSGGIAGDTWVLSWDGHDSAPLAYDITGEDLQTAMEAMDGIESGDVSVSGDGPYVVTFGGLLANTDVAAITGVGGTNEVQTITLSGGIAGDTWVLSWDGHDSAPLAYDITGEDLQTAMEAMDGIESGDVSVSGDGPYVVTFGGLLANTDVAAITGVGGTNEVQTITLSGGIAGDTWVLSWDGHDSAPLAYDITGEDLQTAMEAMDGIESGDVSVSGDGPYVVTFGGLLANTDVAAITGVGGTNEVQTITLSGGIAGDTWVLSWDGHDSAPLAYDITGEDLQTAMEAMDGIESGDVSVSGDGPYVVTFGGLLANTDVAAITGVGGTNEVQTITLNGVTGGTFTLSYSGQTTANIDYDATAEELQNALEGLNNIATGDVAVAGTSPEWTVTFQGTLANTDVALLTGDDTDLTGDPATISIVETTPGNELTIGVVETTPGNELTIGVVETTPGNELTIGVVETTPGNELTIGVVETTPGNELTIGVVETTPGNELTIGVVETTPGNELTIGVVETTPGNEATVGVVETVKGDIDATVTIATVAQGFGWVLLFLDGKLVTGMDSNNSTSD